MSEQETRFSTSRPLAELAGIRLFVPGRRGGTGRERLGAVEPSFLGNEVAQKVRRFYMSVPGYEVTPLVRLSALAGQLGLADIMVKDESRRFGLNAFKGLGGLYAIAQAICQRAGLDSDGVTYEMVRSDLVRERTGQLTFATATAGNHGKGVAWATRQLGHKAVVYVPKGTAKSRIDAVRELGARVVVSDVGYDDTVRLCVGHAEANGWLVIQDTAWDGYTEVPRWIMQGYTTIVAELEEQSRCLVAEATLSDEIRLPTHVFLQAGVGGLAAAVLGCYASMYPAEYPFTTVVEPDRAACILVSAAAGDGKPHSVEEDARGDLNTIMAGLACGEPNLLAWEVLRDYAHAYVACPDEVAARGMRMLAGPAGDDPVVVSGESGAVSMGLLSVLTQHPDCSGLRKELGLDKDSRILLISTEGDTDPANYREIVGGSRMTVRP